MRVLVVTQYFRPQPLANAEVVGGLAYGLGRRGHLVDVVAPVSSRSRTEGVRVHRALGVFWRDRSSLVGRLVEYGTFSVGALMTGLAVTRPDIVVVPSPPPTLGVVGVVLGMLRRRPVVYVVQDLYPEVALATGAVRMGPALRMLGALMRWVYQRCATVVVIDDQLVAVLEAAEPGARVRCVPNGIDTTPFIDSARNVAWLRSIGADPDLPVVMYAGNVGRSQDLESVAGVVGRHRAQLVVHGDGAALSDLRARVRAEHWDHVHFSPYADRSQLGQIYGSADLHIVPLKPGISSASVPSKLLSIFSAGRPAVVAAERSSAAAGLIERSGGGWVVPPGDPAALDACLASVLADPDERERRGRLANVWAQANAGDDVCAGRYDVILKEATRR